MGRKKKAVTHYLITLTITSDINMHCYLMCMERRMTEAATAKMWAIAEEMGLRPLPIVLMTTLSTGVDEVRTILSECSDEAKASLETATDYHCSIWMMKAPHDKSLMALH